MCDTLKATNIPKHLHPEYTYKVCIKDRDGNYFTGIMGQPIELGKWNQAPKRDGNKVKGWSLVDYLFRKTNTNPKLKGINAFGGSSRFSKHHNGKWASFRELGSAKGIFLSVDRNFKRNGGQRFKRVVLKCKIGGAVDTAEYLDASTYLSSSIFPIQEV